MCSWFVNKRVEDRSILAYAKDLVKNVEKTLDRLRLLDQDEGADENIDFDDYERAHIEGKV